MVPWVLMNLILTSTEGLQGRRCVWGAGVKPGREEVAAPGTGDEEVSFLAAVGINDRRCILLDMEQALD